ncbi:hypothetical protein GCM10029963_31510 [Micromonospora andamanensis]|uniref:hypothetical protein n=1 Tax=Micromonospora andamanensis TaxID=1287068 RepID=UPI001950FF36|nr:hypothetical protein [Micromonospora andamanensis]GIJ40415.1 hypothetical protein Vwe01_37400 [Micromonospora andamanensis]
MARWQPGHRCGFAIAVNERFAAGHSPTDVARFVAETLSQFSDAQSLPTMEMEELARAALGEATLIENLKPETALQMQIVFLGKLLQDRDHSEAQLEEFITDVERTAADYLQPTGQRAAFISDSVRPTTQT